MMIFLKLSTPFANDVFNSVIDQYIPPQSLEEQWDIKGLEEHLAQEFGLELPIEHLVRRK